MTSLAQRWLPGLTLLAWAGTLLLFAATGRVNSLLVPAFRPWVVVAGVVLVLMAAILLVAGKGVADCCGHDHDEHSITRSLSGKLLAFAVLIVPSLAAASFAPDGFSATTVRNRGLVEDASGFARDSTRLLSVEPPLPTRDGMGEPTEPPGSVLDYMEKTPEGYHLAEVIDFLFAADEPDLRRDLEGQTVAVVGQIMQDTEGNAQGNRFKLLRMFMNCCAADARPIGVSVRTDTLPAIPEMSWVRVVAKASFPLEGGKPTPVLEAIEVEKVNPPQETMLF